MPIPPPSRANPDMSERSSVFLIGPRRPQPDAVRATIEQVVRSRGFEIVSPQYEATSPTFSLPLTLRSLQEVALVVADLSWERPSCYYELGLAEAAGARLLVIAESGTPIHQTSYRSDVHFFDSLPALQAILGDVLTKLRSLSA